jgi:hypothetical protein
LPYYSYCGGTSFAAPVVAGAVAVLRQAWRRQLKRPPTGAALKALLLLGALPVLARSGGPAAPQDAGFGRLDLAGSLPPRSPLARPGWTVSLRDAATQRIDTGQQRDVTLRLTQAARLRAVLCWYDEPGERLVNDLDLILIDPTGAIGHGSHGSHGSAEADSAAEPDRSNPVERLDRVLAPGRWRLRVRGHNVMAGPQRYALAWALSHPP